MWRRARVLFYPALAALALAALLLAQEGHPLSGTWSGEWASSADRSQHLTFVLNWDGKAVTGIMNPGPNAIPISGVAIDFSNWTVRIEAGAKDAPIVAEGKIEDLASPHRSIRGTMRQGSTQGDFRITRD